MSEKEEITFGHQVTLRIVDVFVWLLLITYTFNLFEPHLASACDTSQVQVAPSQP